MKIKKLFIKNLFGHINKNVSFNDSINLLVGINGSGKTTVLNVINWLIRPSLPELAVNYYDRLSIEFTWKDENYEIEATQNDKEMLLGIRNLSQQKTYHKINVVFKIHPSKLLNREADRERLLTSEYQNLSAEEHELETWKLFFNTIPNPIVVGLDRNLHYEASTNSTRSMEYLSEKLMTERGDFRSGNPLDKIKLLTQNVYSNYKARLIDLNSRLNDKIMLSSFGEVFTLENLPELNESQITLEQVESLHMKVKEYFLENATTRNRRIQKQINEQALKKIENYFNSLKKIINEAKNEQKDKDLNFFLLVNISQFKKIRQLIAEFEDFESRSGKIYEPIKDYLGVLNSFFIDSSKKLYFDKNYGSLKFNVLNREGDPVKKDGDIKALSSGEKQLLILFTYLQFNNKEERIFIIDEPEISLHPKWQSEFLGAVEKLSKFNSQLIIATHSPNIVAHREDDCIVLVPYNDQNV